VTNQLEHSTIKANTHPHCQNHHKHNNNTACCTSSHRQEIACQTGGNHSSPNAWVGSLSPARSARVTYRSTDSTGFLRWAVAPAHRSMCESSCVEIQCASYQYREGWLCTRAPPCEIRPAYSVVLQYYSVYLTGRGGDIHAILPVRSGVPSYTPAMLGRR
jgi:hypothetical protein